VIVKPHPNAVLPAALSVSVLRDVLTEQGLDPNLVTLAVSAQPQLAQALATHAAVASIDFTGGNAFGQWLQAHAPQARLYAEMAGVNLVVIESTDAYAGMLRNLALSLSLYSGQMCTTTQNLLIPAGGIETDQGHRSFEQVGADLAAAIDQLLAEPKVAFTVLGAIGSPQTVERVSRPPPWDGPCAPRKSSAIPNTRRPRCARPRCARWTCPMPPSTSANASAPSPTWWPCPRPRPRASWPSAACARMAR
jgi:acyl-CoA reductase-like NAD-dependent aldehyde dehydrogenase